VLQACVLAVIAGFADTIGYLRYQAFAGLMTGNTIILGIDLATSHWASAFFHGGIIAIFLLGVVVARAALRFGAQVWMVLTVASLLLASCCLVSERLAAFLLALAMGMQNSAANRFNGVALNTVFITGNLQKLGEGLIAWIWPTEEGAPRSDGVAIFGLVWIAYAAGASIGAIANANLSYPLLIPALLLSFVMVSGYDLPSRFLSKTRRTASD
jgi:uncharacterized membrane protein YoaK (UPF0700 family)